jgi:hypothetical protein
MRLSKRLSALLGEDQTVTDTLAKLLAEPGSLIVEGGPWERFGLYNCYAVVRDDGAGMRMPAHAGELVPGSTEDLVAVVRRLDVATLLPPAPMTVELDTTYRCPSTGCGGYCFSATYRALAPNVSLAASHLKALIRTFAANGGRILRFDGGGEPLCHPQVRDGSLVRLADDLGLKTTLLTAGDHLPQADIGALIESDCYIRVSLNAGTEGTRRHLHGQQSSLASVLASVKRLTTNIAACGRGTPVGATFILAPENVAEVVLAARRAQDAGMTHFSARRILGPTALRPSFTASQLEQGRELLAEVAAMHSPAFRVSVPWRALDEPDLSPADGELGVERCWQAAFKCVIEPSFSGSSMRIQPCGRYRGNGIGQLQQADPLVETTEASTWVEAWHEALSEPDRLARLPHVCHSCIDRGFQRLVDGLVGFVGVPVCDFEIHHVWAEDPERIVRC